MRTILQRTILFAAAISAMSMTLAAATLKIASVAPEGTPWGAALNKMAGEWEKASDGKVTLKIYHNGIAGGESDEIRKMKIGQLQGAVVTSFGLSEIAPEVLSLSIPCLIDGDKELEYIFKKMQPYFASKVEAKGYKVVAWSRAGWVRFFSKKPIFYPADLKVQKIAANGDDQALFQTWKTMGYTQVPVNIPDILMALNSGMIDALYSSPIAVGGFQWFGLAKNMSELKIAPFIGAIILKDSVWKSIPADVQPKLTAIAKGLESELNENVTKLEADAIVTMQKYGLVVNPVSDDALKAWKAEFEAGYSKIFGKSFSKEVYDIIVKHKKEFRGK